MPGNYTGGTKGYGTQPTTSQREMAAFDLLPPTLRRALDDAPYSMSSEYVLTYHREKGWKAALKEIEKSSAGYVGQERWQPMTTGFSSTSSRVGRRASGALSAANARRNLRRLGLTMPTVEEYSCGGSRSETR
jgi:hypothetical protein